MTVRPEEQSRVKNIGHVVIGQFKVPTWYFSPYPESVINNESGVEEETILFLCETCLCPFRDAHSLKRHRTAASPPYCPLASTGVPPGGEIYRSSNLGLFEIDGRRQKAWCRNLCLLAKLFLDHKTLYYDVDPFLFYVLVKYDSRGAHLVGYFSKEKISPDCFNVACILTLPQHQRQGFGKLLIALSYELSKREGKAGSPEKPLSDLGLLSYRSYWAESILKILIPQISSSSQISIQELSSRTSITCEDILHTLQALDLLKYFKGQHTIVLSKKVISDFEKASKKPSLGISPDALLWTPLLDTR